MFYQDKINSSSSILKCQQAVRKNYWQPFTWDLPSTLSFIPAFDFAWLNSEVVRVRQHLVEQSCELNRWHSHCNCSYFITWVICNVLAPNNVLLLFHLTNIFTCILYFCCTYFYCSCALFLPILESLRRCWNGLTRSLFLWMVWLAGIFHTAIADLILQQRVNIIIQFYHK